MQKQSVKGVYRAVLLPTDLPAQLLAVRDFGNPSVTALPRPVSCEFVQLLFEHISTFGFPRILQQFNYALCEEALPFAKFKSVGLSGLQLAAFLPAALAF